MRKIISSNYLLFCIIIFFFISISALFTAQSITNNVNNIIIKQTFFYLIGIFVLITSYFKKKEIIKYSLFLYIFFNILLFLLLVLGVSINGSRCWLILGPISFQPSEFMKIFLIIMIAKVLNKYKSHKFSKEFKMLLLIFIILLIPSILTFLEPDTGVVFIYIIITISMILYRGINKKWYIIIFTILGIILVTITSLLIIDKNIIINILDNSIFYRLERIFSWQKQSGYQLENSIITIATSGLTGFGINNIPLYYPESSTDFIFTTFSSNFGFIGNIILFFLIIFFDLSILKIAKRKTKKVDEYIIIGIFSMTIYQQIQNIGMTIGLLPITGITLPFISYGGSSLLSYMFITGMILKISHDNYKYIN